MSDPGPPFAPLTSVGGYPRLEDLGIVGDGRTAALVARDGSMPWLCLPHFDSPPVFCGLLDRERGGAFVVELEGAAEGRQYYEDGTAVLVTELRGPSGVLQIRDALLLTAQADLSEDSAASRSELLRSVRALSGDVRVRVAVLPRGGAELEARGGGVRVRLRARDDLDLQLSATRALPGLDGVHELRAGERLDLVLGWGEMRFRPRAREPEELLEKVRAAWRSWAERIDPGPLEPALVLRSAITLKLLDFFENGAMVAAPTSSLPEEIGGTRNWDYRFTWIRDAAFSVYALLRVGLAREAAGFLAWVLDAVESHGRPCVLYRLDGGRAPPEREDEELEGYRGSRPVRWGNAAAAQRQHDVYGEILDCAYQWQRHHGELDRGIWDRLAGLVESARREWRDPDHGIWEVRTPGRPFTYSAALCQVALDRGARLAETLGYPGDVAGWREDAERIRAVILAEAWDPDRRALVEHVGGGGGLDASLLALPLRRVIPADHPRMVATVEAIRRELGAGSGLVYRYRPRESPDGLPGHDGAFLLCSFWLSDNLALQGRLDDARELFHSLCARASPLGLLPEEIDPGSGAFLGNFPQALSHVGLITSALTIGRLEEEREGRAHSSSAPRSG